MFCAYSTCVVIATYAVRRVESLKLDEVSTNANKRDVTRPPSHLEPHYETLATPPITLHHHLRATMVLDAIDSCARL
jgi:hypothetical protein